MASFFQPVVDTTRVFLNSAMGNLPELLGDQRATKLVEDSRARTGTVGDIANAVGYLAPIGAISGAVKAAKGLKYLPTLAKGVTGGVKSAAKAVPAAERAVARKVVPGYAARENALTRLATPYAAGKAQHFAVQMPTISGAIGRTVAAHPVKTLGAAGVVGVGTFAGHNNRRYDEQNPPQAQARIAEPAPVAQAQQVKAEPMVGDSRSFADRAIEAYRANQAAQPNTFDAMMDQIAQAQGGQISLAQMSALAEVAQRTMPRGRQPTARDQVTQRLMARYDQLYDAESKQLGEAVAQKNWDDRMALLNKMDPLAAYLQDALPQPEDQ